MPELALTMPKMSMTMEEGTMVVWLKNVGDAVKSGEPVCEVTTDKVDMEVESPFDGTLARITADPDEVIKVGDPIAYITTEADDLLGGIFDELAPDSAAEATDAIGGSIESGQAGTMDGADSDSSGESVRSDWVAAVPLARRIATDNGVDLHDVVSSGPWGSVRVADVEAAVSAQAPATPAAPAAPAARAAPGPAAPARPTVDPIERRRRSTRLAVAKTMAASAAIPQFTAFRLLDLTALSAVRKSDLGGASWTAILVQAQALALRENPQLNGFWADDGVHMNDDIGIALAVDSPSGLLAPVLRNPDRLPLIRLADQIRQMVGAAREGSITAQQMDGGTTVFSNLGGLGVDSFNALLTPPHVTALSAGSIRERVVARDRTSFGLRLTCTAGLTVDHRAADGADAARYLTTLDEIVTSPKRLVLR